LRPDLFISFEWLVSSFEYTLPARQLFSKHHIETKMATRKNNAAARKTRKNVATRKNNANAPMAGGKRKLSPALKKWNMHVMSLYRTMKAKNKNTKLRDAMKAAKKTFRKH
jgi:hypothetical protein